MAVSNVLATMRGWASRHAFMSPQDISLFLGSARTDASIARLRAAGEGERVFEAIYAASPDPWLSASGKYRYQRRKYEGLVGLLPRGRFFPRVLDVGCGVGRLSSLLAARGGQVLGMDVSPSAIRRAQADYAGITNLTFEQGDVTRMPSRLNGAVDLLVIADVLYYLAPLNDAVLGDIARSMASLLAPGGMCLLANHFFFAADPGSRLSRRIHRAFASCPGFRVTSEHRRPFYIATLFAAG